MKKKIKVWRCPNCMKKSIIIQINNATLAAKISCGSCDLYVEMKAKKIYDPIDVYGDFIDEYYENPLKHSMKKNNLSDSKSIIVHITTQSIIKSLLLNWKNLTEIKEDLNIESDLDFRYLKLKLKELERKFKLEVKRIGTEKYWRTVKKK